MTMSDINVSTFILEGFQHSNTHHCVTGSMKHVYEYNHHTISEEMLLGLGEGVSFIYWHQKGGIPFIGGRGNPKPSMEVIAGHRTGVEIIPKTTSSSRKAKQSLLELLSYNKPVMVQVDMGFLPYFDFDGTDYHFGGHVITVCGYDSDHDLVLAADRDGLHEVPMEDLEKARHSPYKPFPPKNKWYLFDFTHKRQPFPEEIYQAIAAQAQVMLEPPISNIGTKGIQKTARMIPSWADKMNQAELKWALFNAYIFISPVGGTGGGIFRYMFSRFLDEGAKIADDHRLKESAEEFRQIGDHWQELGDWFLWANETENPGDHLVDCVKPLNSLADLEEAAWRKLYEVTLSSSGKY